MLHNVNVIEGQLFETPQGINTLADNLRLVYYFRTESQSVVLQ